MRERRPPFRTAAAGTLAAAGFLTTVGLSTAAQADYTKPTIWDRVDQIFSTFMMDPAANVDIDLKRVLDTWRDMKPKPFDELSAEDARRQPSPIDAAASVLQKQGKTLDPYPIEVKDTTFPGADGELKARIYIPQDASSTKAGELRPVIVFYHGGGFVLENTAGTEASARAIAQMAHAIVVAPDYRLAPEHKFPAAPDDALAAYKWVIANAASFGGNAGKIAIAGEGAGGNLAMDTAIAARDANLQRPVALALITPAAGIDLKTNSWLEDSTARPWNKEAVKWALGKYLPDPAAKYDPRLDIVGKADLSKLPVTIIVTAEDDPLRSDGERLGGKLKRAFVPVDMRDYPGMTHDFFGMGGAVEGAAEAEHFVGDNLMRAFNPPANDVLALERMGVAPYTEAADPVTNPPDVGIKPPMPSTPQ